ncbi:MAG: glycine cleavage system aminomethyltransferase GcvT [Dactylosporangium sp.]|nr:glycine cleavage system aminomethyltransferase GcvT [Dactylosporangium sp.]NNJ61208.1 glycine cleavage system aminomethyltransferase GcvT [Dactylosporangium sp.]
MTQSLFQPVLTGRHEGLGAKFAAFGGWRMPVEYAGGGVLREHAAVREAVGMFDVSHLGTVTVRGRPAVDYLNRCLSNDLDRVADGQAQYTLCCDDAGGIVDDLIVYRCAEDEVLCVPNAANAAAVVARLAGDAPAGVEVVDRHTEYAIIAVQGPRSADLLLAAGLPAGHGYLSFVRADDVVVCRSGYTGEHGYELIAPVRIAGGLWDRLLAAGAPMGVLPCGLGARDTLRTEMGYPLHGQDLSREISPLQAGLGWAVGWDKPEFWGRRALLAERAAGPRRRAIGLETLARAVPRPGMTVSAGPPGSSGAATMGVVTSGTFSPSRRVGIALTLLDADAGWRVGDEVSLDVRARPVRSRLVKPPFVPSRVR